MTKKESGVVVLPALAQSVSSAHGAHVARLVALASDGAVAIALEGSTVAARLAIPASRERLETAVLLQQQAVVVFEGGDPARPIIIGLMETLAPPIMQPAPAALPATESAVRDNERSDAPSNVAARLPMIEADVDGKRVRVTAKDELVLQCGSASITLRRNGRVIVRGTYVETHSDGTNRIKGGQVLIN